MNDSKFTLGDYEKFLSQTSNALKDVPSLIRYLEKNHPNPFFRKHYPCGIVSGKMVSGKGNEIITYSPYLCIKPEYILLSEETSTSFNLIDIRVGNISSNVTPTSIPLETFGINYYANAKNPEQMFSLQKWNIDSITPGQRLSFYVENITDKPKPFRGIMWALGQEFL